MLEAQCIPSALQRGPYCGPLKLCRGQWISLKIIFWLLKHPWARAMAQRVREFAGTARGLEFKSRAPSQNSPALGTETGRSWEGADPSV